VTPSPPQKSGKQYFSSNYHVEVGHFSDEYSVKFGHFDKFNTYILLQKCHAPKVDRAPTPMAYWVSLFQSETIVARLFTAQCTLVQSAVLGSHVVRLLTPRLA